MILQTDQLIEVKILNDIYTNLLVDVIDGALKFCDNYDAHVKDKYTLL